MYAMSDCRLSAVRAPINCSWRANGKAETAACTAGPCFRIAASKASACSLIGNRSTTLQISCLAQFALHLPYFRDTSVCKGGSLRLRGDSGAFASASSPAFLAQKRAFRLALCSESMSFCFSSSVLIDEGSKSGNLPPFNLRAHSTQRRSGGAGRGKAGRGGGGAGRGRGGGGGNGGGGGGLAPGPRGGGGCLPGPFCFRGTRLSPRIAASCSDFMLRLPCLPFARSPIDFLTFFGPSPGKPSVESQAESQGFRRPRRERRALARASPARHPPPRLPSAPRPAAAAP